MKKNKEDIKVYKLLLSPNIPCRDNLHVINMIDGKESIDYDTLDKPVFIYQDLLKKTSLGEEYIELSCGKPFKTNYKKILDDAIVKIEQDEDYNVSLSSGVMEEALVSILSGGNVDWLCDCNMFKEDMILTFIGKGNEMLNSEYEVLKRRVRYIQGEQQDNFTVKLTLFLEKIDDMADYKMYSVPFNTIFNGYSHILSKPEFNGLFYYSELLDDILIFCDKQITSLRNTNNLEFTMNNILDKWYAPISDDNRRLDNNYKYSPNKFWNFTQSLEIEVGCGISNLEFLIISKLLEIHIDYITDIPYPFSGVKMFKLTKEEIPDRTIYNVVNKLFTKLSKKHSFIKFNYKGKRYVVEVEEISKRQLTIRMIDMKEIKSEEKK